MLQVSEAELDIWRWEVNDIEDIEGDIAVSQSQQPQMTLSEDDLW